LPRDRASIVGAVDGERAYQRAAWGRREVGEDGRESFVEDRHEVPAFILFLEHHLAMARSFAAGSSGDYMALDQLRKVAALCLACFEQHGVPSRILDAVVNHRDGMPVDPSLARPESVAGEYLVCPECGSAELSISMSSEGKPVFTCDCGSVTSPSEVDVDHRSADEAPRSGFLLD
jgi:hypothetical protein